MNLTPEEKAVGKENFHAAIGSDVTPKENEESRREFLKKCGKYAVIVPPTMALLLTWEAKDANAYP